MDKLEIGKTYEVVFVRRSGVKPTPTYTKLFTITASKPVEEGKTLYVYEGWAGAGLVLPNTSVLSIKEVPQVTDAQGD